MKKLILAGFVSTVVTFLAFAQEVKTERDESLDFSGFKTYQWRLGMKIPHEPNHERMMAAVTKDRRDG